MKSLYSWLLTCVFSSTLLGYGPAKDEKPLHIPFEKYELSNGLDVILHEDHSIPMVSVNVWYHVGSKNEKPGRTGFAHLFEHLMFEGSKHHNSNFAEPLEKVGGTDNGSTSTDRTNYWSNVPSNELEMALWLEADRMGFLLDVMTQDKLNNQRDVVKNERRQNYENTPYGKAWEIIPDMMFPADHPYSWIPIGSMEDLSAASLEDVSEFFRTYYVPNNASLSIAGDFDSEQTKAWVQKYFGGIPPGKTIDRTNVEAVQMDGIVRRTAKDNVSLPMLIYGWHTPGFYHPGDAEMDHLANILTSGKTSRLYKLLVYELQIAQDVSAFQWSREIGSTFHIMVTGREGHTVEEIESVLDAELEKLIRTGVNRAELEQSKTHWEAGFIRGLEQIGGFGGKADALNGYNILLGDPGRFNWDLNRYRNVSTQDVKSAIQKFIKMDERAILKIVPADEMSSSEENVNRNFMPGASGELSFTPPIIQRTELSNGIKLLLIEDHKLPLVEVTTILNSGWAADPVDKPGAGALTADLLDEGTKRRDAMEIATEAKRLGTDIGTSSFFDGTYISFNSLKKNLDPSLELMSDIILNPTFPEEELTRKKQEYLGRIQQENKQPVTAAIKHYFRLLFGDGHPYGQPYTGSGTEESISAITRDDLLEFYNNNYFSNNAAIVVAGDITINEAVSKLEKYLGKWKGGVPAFSEVPDPKPRTSTEVYLMDKPGAPQSVIIMGNLGLRRSDPDYLATSVMNTAFGSKFTSRLNMNLREDKGYTYGTGSFFSSRKGIGPFGTYAPVQTQYTKASIQELLKELNDIVGSRPLTELEVADTKNNLINKFPRKFEGLSGITDQADDLVMFDLPDNYWDNYMDNVSRITGEMASQAARDHIHPDALLIVVVGDLAVIEEDIRDLKLGPIHHLDKDGNIID